MPSALQARAKANHILILNLILLLFFFETVFLVVQLLQLKNWPCPKIKISSILPKPGNVLTRPTGMNSQEVLADLLMSRCYPAGPHILCVASLWPDFTLNHQWTCVDSPQERLVYEYFLYMNYETSQKANVKVLHSQR